MKDLTLDFGEKLFDKETMRLYLPNPVYKKWKQSVSMEEPMTKETADAIAHAMKVWAIEKGATHYSHWFHPMTGSSAEKHDAFLEPDRLGNPIARFSGKTLIKGETDGSSFPNGGLRQTFEARGYTYWDVTSPAFVRGHVLFIPSIFIAYEGESLDEKAPLIRAMTALSKHAVRVVNALGEKSVTHVKATVGLEQEYFLVDKDMYYKRDDLLYTGRTMIGARPPKGQELISHYFSAIPSKVVHFMEDVNEELWKLGVYSKVEHNEVAPNQFEIAAVFQDANVAIDQNMLVMETIRRVALKHDMVALLHEKPFAYINGSGKHNNFSLISDHGHNLFDPGDKPQENIRFLVFVAALMRAVDKYATLLRFAASSPGNDHRLGASEAPPAIISMFIGEVLDDIFKQLSSETNKPEKETQYFTPMNSLSALPKDYSDRNRTSPFAFTGNKFEFRMPGASICSAFVNASLCAILAESLSEIADELETFKYVGEARERALELVTKIYKEHQRIIFNGDGYHDSWITEAEKRGLPNITKYLDSAHTLIDEKTVALFEKHSILTKRELEARHEIAVERYVETIDTEARVLIQLVRRQVMPAVLNELAAVEKTSHLESKYIKSTKALLTNHLDVVYEKTEALDALLGENAALKDVDKRAKHMENKVRPLLSEIRAHADDLEAVISKEYYPMPTYTDLLFKMK